MDGSYPPPTFARAFQGGIVLMIAAFFRSNQPAVMAAVPLVLAGVVLRRSFVAASMERSAAVGAACALAAVTTMHLHCENIQVGHMLLGHMVPAAAITVLAALVLRSVTRA